MSAPNESVVCWGLAVMKCEVKRCREPATYAAAVRFGDNGAEMVMCSEHLKTEPDRMLARLKRAAL